ncbi:endothelin-converting enzyme 1-like [Actinia tenebrosa]|uniref:Endothelin-converting enzyme 1-like n=1 Tax=Actinia tenebrosa TaxID=6105 RepID=A0A6P8HJT5_ACTTE|nr:endothelin-converting enzyme 1-like [Actinia tenebrosa]
MKRMMNGGSVGRQENKQWLLIHGPRFLTILLVISMIHVAASQNKMSTLDQGLNKIRSPRYVKTTGQNNNQSSRVCNTTECIKAAKRIKSSMNTTVDPCDDFYEYACGRWLQNTTLPNRKPFSFYEISDEIKDKKKRFLTDILETGKISITIKGAKKSLVKLPLSLYQSCMNQKAIDNVGVQPLKERINDLGGWSMVEEDRIWNEDSWNFNTTIGFIHKNYQSKGGPLFSLYAHTKQKPDPYSIYIDQLEYEEQDPQKAANRTAAEKKYITDVVKFLGGNRSIAIKVQELLDFQNKLKEGLTDPDENPMRNLTLDQLQQEVPQFNWSKHLNHIFAPHNITGTEIIHVALPYLRRTMELVQNASKSVLSNYLVWHVIKKEVAYLSTPYRRAYSSFINETAISTAKHRLNCLDEAELNFNDILEAAYITIYGKKKKKIENMVKQLTNDIRQAIKENINSLTWLDTDTRRKMTEKVDKMKNEIGFPDYLSSPAKVNQIFQKYNSLTLKKDEYFKNKIVTSKFNHQQMLMKFRQPGVIDRWSVFAHEGEDGPFYLVDYNLLIQPLASLEPPYFYENGFLRAFNFGALGAKIGLQISYGFGPDGRKHDKNGQRFSTGQGWSMRSLRNIEIKGRCFARQYSQYKLFGRWQVNGNYTFEYNIVENGGLKAANKAYHDWAQRNPRETWLLPKLALTNEQLFYTAFAQTYCRKGTPEGLHKAFIEDGSYDNKFGYGHIHYVIYAKRKTLRKRRKHSRSVRSTRIYGSCFSLHFFHA